MLGILKKKKIIISLVVIVLVIAGIVFWRIKKGNNPSDQYLTEQVQKMDLSQTVSATGDLKSKSEIMLNFENSGRVGKINVKVGDEVGEGETLANISSDILSKQLEKAQSALDKAVAEAGSSDYRIKELEQTVDNAEDYLDETKDLEDQKIIAAQQAYEDASDYYDEAVDYYDLIVDASGANSAEAQYAKLTMKTAETNKHNAEEALETTRKAKDLAEVSAENAVNSAKKSLKTAESQYATDSKNATVEAARADYDIALANLEKSSLKAPVSGTITEINYDTGEVLGSSSVGATSFGKMISKDFVLEALISESDISKVSLGQIAELSFDALSFDETIEAEIIEVEPAATVIQDVVYYRTKLKINKNDPRLKEGMSADVDILVDEAKGVLAVSQSSVDYEKAKTFVRVIDENGNIERRQVQAGLEGDSGMVEIKSGLQEGETVVISEKKN